MASAVIGNVAKCKRGIIGIITNKKGDVYFGFTLNNKAWQSIDPDILASNLLEYIQSRLENNIAEYDENREDKLVTNATELLHEIGVGTPVGRARKVENA
jgi:hypothetical protein